jgi:hypothetical protein
MHVSVEISGQDTYKGRLAGGNDAAAVYSNKIRWPFEIFGSFKYAGDDGTSALLITFDNTSYEAMGKVCAEHEVHFTISRSPTSVDQSLVFYYQFRLSGI